MEISPIKDTLRIALVGDYSPDIVAHQAIPLLSMMLPPSWNWWLIMTG